MDKQLEQTLKLLVNQAVTNGETAGCSMMILKDGREIFYHQAGYADIETEKPICRDTLYRFYSMTKPMTAIAAMILLERGLLDLREPVETFLPGFRNQKVCENGILTTPVRPVLIRDLLDMTSGLSYPGDATETERQVSALFTELDERLYSDHPMTTVELANRLGQCPLLFQPGSRWQYGTSADVLGAVIEVISGMSFGNFIKKNILDPLHMENTGFSVDPCKLHLLATAYEACESGFIPYRGNHLGIINAMDTPAAFESGGAGLVSSIDDYKTFTQMLLNEGEWNGVRILRPKTVRFLTSEGLDALQQDGLKAWTDLTGYSYGNLMRILKKPGQAMSLGSEGEYGWDGWLGCYFSNSPKDKLTILFMHQKKDAGIIPTLRKARNLIYANLT